MKLLKTTLFTAVIMVSGSALADQVILDDLIVDGSACIGFDCVNGESFGFTTLKLKENNLRLKFEDTSTGGFPGADWELVANDSSNGGQNRFSIRHSSANRTPFTVEGNAPNNSLYVDDGGRVGLGTNIPVADLHTKSGNTPTVRLEQDGSSGFAAQTWDMAGNETSFFIRDVTNGSTLPFRIRPGSVSQALVIDDDNVGINILTPSDTLHVRDNDGTTKLLVEEANATAAARTLMELKNNGNTKFSLTNTQASEEWSFANPGTGMRISRQGSGDVEFDLLNNGNLEIAGTLTENSDRNAKTNIVAVDQQAILDKVKALPLSRWQYKDAVGENHIGPMAQDFYAAFGLGKTDTGISTLDTSGVALAAIQALAQENQQLRASQLALESRLRTEMDARLAAQQTVLNEQQRVILELKALLSDQLQRQSDRLVMTTTK